MNRTSLRQVLRRSPASLTVGVAAVALSRLAACGGNVDVGGDHSGGAAGTGGAAGGASCIPGGTAVEAKGSAAEAQVQTPDRCNEGFTCNSAKVCVTIPGCSATPNGDCVVYPALGAGGTGGAGGASGAGDLAGVGGMGGSAPDAVAEPAVTGLAVDDSNLYFINYGTRDPLGNYKNDGAVWAFSFKSGATATIATGLQGPIALGVTSGYAYVGIDGAPLIGSPAHPQVLRVPLSGGKAELVQDNAGISASPGYFLGTGPLAFWVGSGPPTYVMSDTALAPTVLSADLLSYMATDGQNLYYSDCPCIGVSASNIWREPLGGGTPQMLVSPFHPFGVTGDSIYAVEGLNNETGIVLDQAPASGGTWKRIRALGAGGVASKFQLAGDRIFVEENPPEQGPYVQRDFLRINVVTASLSSDAPPIRLLQRAAHPNFNFIDHLWIGTAQTFFWSDGNAIYAHAIASPP